MDHWATCLVTFVGELIEYWHLTWHHTAESTLTVTQALALSATVFVLFAVSWTGAHPLVTQNPLWTLLR